MQSTFPALAALPTRVAAEPRPVMDADRGGGWLDADHMEPSDCPLASVIASGNLLDNNSPGLQRWDISALDYSRDSRIAGNIPHLRAAFDDDDNGGEIEFSNLISLFIETRMTILVSPEKFRNCQVAPQHK
ncbi:hypothetical protein CFD26_102020 [Aspergillus turcosus]|uniref:Uncharacterized protein n=1 Tax=Aspergillus turcosus TaxID=1245748 RepID=A0A421D4U9_9EURO|nr:hypothetical protein CFD26_102020 [Aspergillus turcosus]